MKHKRTMIEKMAISIIVLTVLLIIGMFTAYSLIGYQIFNNPEGIGEWFSRLLSGFKQ